MCLVGDMPRVFVQILIWEGFFDAQDDWSISSLVNV
jgi:hypothetical protein